MGNKDNYNLENRETPINKGNYSLDIVERETRFDEIRSEGWEEKYQEYRRKWVENPKATKIEEYPILLDLELSTACNLSCPFCYTITKEFKSKIKKQFMDIKLYKRIIDEVATKIYALRLSYRGESTLHPNFIEAIQYAKDMGIREVSFLTNGSNLNEDFFEKILLAGVDWITISFDGLFDEYEKNRYPLKYNQMYERLKKIKSIKEQYNTKKPVIKIQTIWPAIEENPTEFYNIMKEVSDLVAFNPLIDFSNSKYWDKDLFFEDFVCPMLFQRLVIASSGEALICTNDEKSKCVIGDANKQTIYEIWQSDEIRRIRELHIKGNYQELEVCRECYVPHKTYDTSFFVDGREVTVSNYL